jgi:hypothetical protein
VETYAVTLDRDKHRQETDDAYRAIGRYIVVFSELVRMMRMETADFVGGSGRWLLVDIILGEAQAKPITDAFFGMCRHAADYTKPEGKVASALKKGVMRTITDRNDIAHGDWHVGYVLHDAENKAHTTMPPYLRRIHPTREAGAYKNRELTVQEIDRMTDKLLELLTTVAEFGKLALGLPLQRINPDGSSSVSRGEFRVGDIYVATGGKDNESGDVKREGPKADSLYLLRYT